jgi:hypothetical protein
LPKRVGIGPDAAAKGGPDVASDSTDVEVVLPADDSPATGRLEGRVVSPTEGEALGELLITVRRGDEIVGLAAKHDPDDVGRESAAYVVIVKPDGASRSDAVPVGALSLEVKARGWLPPAPGRRRGPRGRDDDGAADRDAAARSCAGPCARRASLRGSAAVSFPAGGGRPVYTVAVAKDGTYQDGILAGHVRRGRARGGSGERPSPGPAPPRRRHCRRHRQSAEIAFDVDFVPAGMITLEPTDPRLPPPLWEERPVTEAQARFGAATRVRVTADDGTVVLDRTGAFQQGLRPGRRHRRLGRL